MEYVLRLDVFHPDDILEFEPDDRSNVGLLLFVGAVMEAGIEETGAGILPIFNP